MSSSKHSNICPPANKHMSSSKYVSGCRHEIIRTIFELISHTAGKLVVITNGGSASNTCVKNKYIFLNISNLTCEYT